MSKHSRVCRSIMVASLVLVGGVSCSTERQADPNTARSVQTVRVEVERAGSVTVPNVLELDGTLRARRSARVSPLVSGHVSRVLVERGDVVEEGQTLIELRATDYRLEAQAASARATAQLEQLGVAPGATSTVDPDQVPAVAAAKADWEALRDQRDRSERLHATGALSEQQLTQSRSAEAAAHARYLAARHGVAASLASYAALTADAARSRDNATNSRIRAPFDGSIVQRMADVGEFVSPQAPVVELVDASELRLELQVPERYSTQIHEGQPVEVIISGTETPIAGTVRFVSAAIDERRRTLTVEAIVPNTDGSLRAGHFAHARIALGGNRELVRVPASAVSERAGVARLFVIEDGVAQARIVNTIRREGEVALVSGEIRPGESVVRQPPRALTDGVRVDAITPAAER